MKLRGYTSEAIVLARRNYSEADRILIVYTKDFGKLHLLAKGVRKPRSRKRGHIEVFSHIRFSAARGKNLDLVTEVETMDSFKSVRGDLKKVAVAYFLMEVIGRITREEEENTELYSLIVRSLNSLKNTKSLRSFRYKFVHEALALLGFWPKDKMLVNPDRVLEEIVEKQISSVRVGKKILN